MKQRLILAICLFLFPFSILPAQEDEITAEAVEAAEAAEVEEPEEPAEPIEPTEEKDQNASYIEMDIRTSSLMELAAWCRELGLSEGGTREDLASRLRSHYNISSARTSQAEQRIITIESAKTTEYFTLEAVDEEYARLRGDVIVSLKDGAAVHRIKAWEILYNRTRNVLSATGAVEYVKEEGDSRETFKGASITVNLDNWSSIFVEGASEKSRAGTGAAYRFAGTVISRNDEEVTVLTGAEITNAANEESYWSLHASKLWLLPGNDWAILNAVLKVGNVPLLYLPFFYYPSDEIVFHPVLGVRTRDGTFLQTTIYILGQPKTDQVTENSITKIFGGASGDTGKIREGVFLRSSGEKKVDPNEATLKVFADGYVNMGAFLGTEFLLPQRGPFGEITLEAGLGITRDVYQSGGGYTPFETNSAGWDHLNWSDFFGMSLPLRFRFKSLGAMQFKYGSFSWNIPYYSDPYVDRDFMRRSELLDWFAMLRDGATAEDTDIINPLSSYEWRLGGSVNPQVNFLAPYVSSFSVSSISSSLTFNTRITSPSVPLAATPANPGETFFFPNRFIIYSASASVSGNPLSLGTSTNTPAKPVEAPPGDKLLPDLPLSPWENDAGESETAAGAAVPSGEYDFAIPALAQKFDLPGTGGARFTVDYRLSPTSASEMKFDSNWQQQDDIDWTEISNVLTSFGTSGDIGLSLNHTGGGAYSAALRFSGNLSKKVYWLNEDSTDYTTGGAPDAAKIEAAYKQADRESYFNSYWDLSGSVRPFFRNAVFANTSLQYSVKGLLAKNSIESSGDREWTIGEWDKENIQSHQFSANVSANVMDYNQTFSVSLVLPPLDSSITANATFRTWISETSVRGQIKNFWDSDDGDFTIMPITINQSFKLGAWGSMGGFVELDPERDVKDDERNRLTRITANISLLGFSAAFSAAYARPYRLNNLFSSGVGQLWELQSEDRFEPRSLDFRYAKTFEKKDLWGKQLSFSMNVNTSLSFDLQRHTNSKFNFNLGLNLKVTNFLDIQFNTRSENNLIYRYKLFGVFFWTDPGDLYGDKEDRFFVDLFKSFNFFNTQDRKDSGFKLKELSLSLIHHLGDWNAKLTMTMIPTLMNNQYKFRNEISFLIQWVPIEEIRTEMIYKEDKLTVK